VRIFIHIRMIIILSISMSEGRRLRNRSRVL
jgi:hypothetical protein